jgi:hypothetical protein
MSAILGLKGNFHCAASSLHSTSVGSCSDNALALSQVRVTLVKDGKIDVTQMSKEDEEAEEAAKGGVGTMSRATAEAGNMFQFALARAGISGATFETDVSRFLAAPV